MNRSGTAAAGYHQQPAGAGPARRRRRSRGKVVLTVLVVLLLLLVGLWFYVDSSLKRVTALADYPDRPAAGAGTNWLLVGSDARDGLSEEEKAELATGSAAGHRTDTIMIMHIPDGSGNPILVSLPRDSYVSIPGHDKNKINAAFAIGGPPLLARTVEQATGLRMDHYVEIGFGGFANVVDDVGGVEMCLDEPMKDPKAGIDLPAGCQELNGAQALGFVRTRAFQSGDLERVQNQRKFLSALLHKATSAAVLANPFRSLPLAFDLSDAISVGDDDHLHNLAGLAFALGGGMDTATAPVGGFDQVSGAGSVVVWNQAKAKQLFGALRDGTPVPADLVQQPAG
ncbi:LCP family protein [Goodfellowiella coeruleoviolacea]|uniref:LCP family protein n=1 Tax=Goodfellowiella coeruleoviolacea TaxID=334858 RepID=UPI0020A47A79|nr:LCP family protein [Goodfellowiella coeruleoviolacea]